jgi:hypothetical protein
MTIWSILGPFCVSCGHLVYFSPLLVFCTEKNLAALPPTGISKCAIFSRGRLSAAELLVVGSQVPIYVNLKAAEIY